MCGSNISPTLWKSQPGDIPALQHSRHYSYVHERCDEADERDPVLHGAQRSQQHRSRGSRANYEEQYPQELPGVDSPGQCGQTRRCEEFEETKVNEDLHRPAFPWVPTTITEATVPRWPTARSVLTKADGTGSVSRLHYSPGRWSVNGKAASSSEQRTEWAAQKNS